MMLRSKLVGALAGAALLTVSASPAAARGHDRWRHRHDDGVDAGAVIGVLAAVGIFAAIASSANDRRDRDYDERGYDNRDYAPDYGESGYGRNDGGYDDRPYDDQGADYAASAADPDYAGVDMDAGGEDEAANACAAAARDQSTRTGGFAEVRAIDAVRPFGNGFDVTGRLDQRLSDRSGDSRLRSFRCVWENGQVNGVSID